VDHPVWPLGLWAAAITLVWEAYSDIAGSPTIMSVVQPFLGPPGSTIYSSRGSPSPQVTDLPNRSALRSPHAAKDQLIRSHEANNRGFNL